MDFQNTSKENHGKIISMLPVFCAKLSFCVGYFNLRMYCIDRARVPESHDAQATYCLYD